MIQEIPLEKLKIHPRNVRKSYNDIDELAASIRAQGILQNLTVVPDPDDAEMYLVVIGNRRLTAARKAGIKTAPCYVAALSEREQASMMLLENMQRNDLTITEQSQGFQMVLDLGETEGGLADKTGFSKTTIRRRLNIAKLDQEKLAEKEQDRSFQLSLTDLYELEKVPDIKERNKILEEARDSKDMAWRVSCFVAEKQRKETSKRLVKMFKKAGIEKAPEKVQHEIYTNKWETVKVYQLEEEPPASLDVGPEGKETLYWYESYREIKIIRKTKKQKRDSSELTPEEQKQKIREQNKKKIKDIAKEAQAQRRDFIKKLIEDGAPTLKSGREQLIEKLWELMIDCECFAGTTAISEILYGKEKYLLSADEKEELQKKIPEIDMAYQIMAICLRSIGMMEIVTYTGAYKKDSGKKMQAFDAILGQFGFSYIADEEKQVVDGSYKLYENEEGK